MIAPEFSRAVAVETIGAGRDLEIIADDAERVALAKRFGWEGIGRLEATVRLVVRAAGIDATGQLRAALTQACVATGDPVETVVDEAFAVRFVDADALASDQDEIELAPDDLDIIDYEGGSVDVGEAVAQTLALSVDPFPRSPGAGDEPILYRDDADAGPFAVLKGLGKK